MGLDKLEVEKHLIEHEIISGDTRLKFRGIRNHTKDFYNGTFRESFDFLVTATTGPDVVTGTLTNAVSGNLTMQFSTGDFELDLSTNGTIVLTEGTFNTPKTNWVYIPISTKVLTVSETGYPLAEEYIPVAFTFLPNTAEIVLDGAFVNQNWNDHLTNTIERGHMSHIGEVIRLGTGYNSGIAPNGLDQDSNLSYFDDGAAISFKATSGVTYQMHRHTIPAFDTSGSDDIHVVNWSGDNYHSVSDLKDIVADSAGGSLSNKYFNVFFFVVGNKSGEYAPFMAMLPSGSYVSQTSAQNDVDGHDNLSMPREFILDSTVGVPICRMTMRWSGGLSTLTHISTTDLRTGGLVASGGATGTTTTFADNQFNIFDEADITKIMNFDVGTYVPTGTTNVYQFPSAAGILALTSQTDGTIAVADISDIATTYLAIDGSNANTTIDIGSQDLTANIMRAAEWQGIAGVAPVLVTNDLNMSDNNITAITDIAINGNIDLGTNTISDGAMTGDWDMNNTTLTNISSINGGTLSGNNSGDQSASDFNHDDLSNITGTASQYNHPTDANMTVLGNTSNTNSGDQDLSHTGEVTGTTQALLLDKTAISNQSDTVITASDYILFGDATDTAALKKDTVQGILDLATVSGVVPIGGVVSWLKSYTNTPALDGDYVECNGQTLSDGDSVYDGQVIPNLNGSGGVQKFLRGSTTSGTTGGSATHTHTITSSFKAINYATGANSDKLYNPGSNANSFSTLPSYYEVVFVVRIK